jgi:glycerophosphoryl diester phosphodiesterase
MKIYAHRGARAYAPENTLSAFYKAIQSKADGIELDVHLTLDGEVVVCHDHDIARTSNGRGLIANYRLAELKQYDFGSWFAPQYKNEKIPTLREVLTLIQNTNLLLNIEIKNAPLCYRGIEQKILDLLTYFQITERVIISSFHHPTLYKLKLINPDIKTGVLLDCRPLDPVRLVIDAQADYLHPCWIYMDEEVMQTAGANGIGINVYTVNTPEEHAFIERFKVAGIITDYPDRF